MLLGDLLGIDSDSQVTGFAIDHRKIAPGTVFGAFRGTVFNGEDFIDEAVKAGAVAIVARPEARVDGAVHVASDEPRREFARLAARFFQPFPETLVAVTGTNGKTSNVELTRQLWRMTGLHAASIGTLGVTTADEQVKTGLTTPDIVTFLANMAGLAREGVTHAAFEASSHGLAQFRTEGLPVRAAAFTNFSRDHLDYHGTMEEYFASKAMLVSHLVSDGAVVLNVDDPAWDALPAVSRTHRFGLGPRANVRAGDVRYGPRGSEWSLLMGAESFAVRLPLIGDFNVANALAAAAAAWAMQMTPAEIARRLTTMPQVPGRLEIISEDPTVLRDYAHTPDALERALDAVRPFTAGRLVCVFGCGGDRDRGKRPEMGRIAQERADLAIATSDNPRTEDPERILDDVEEGMTAGAHERITDRREAIAHALRVAQPGDVVVLAGKGHETYQVRGTVKYPFDEREIVREIISEGIT